MGSGVRADDGGHYKTGILHLAGRMPENCAGVQPSSICIVATAGDGTTKTGYFNSTGQDKAIFAANIMSDVVMDIVKINAEDIKKILGGTE
jgi:hypothetical protein